VRSVRHETSELIANELAFFDALSRADSPEHILSVYLRHRRPVRSFAHYVMFLPEPGEAGAYRLLASGALPPDAHERFDDGVDAQRALATTLRRGGVLGALCQAHLPLALGDLRPAGDDPFPPSMRSGALVPLFDNDPPGQRLLLLNPDDQPPTAEQVAEGVTEANLLSRMIALARLRQQVSSLNDRLAGQIDEVVRVQRSLLPQALPVLPGLRVAAHYSPSGSAGGDYYDFVHNADGTLGVAVADVSGHGPGAAVIMAQMRAATHSAVLSGTQRPALEINAILASSISPGMFVTAVLALVDPRTGAVGAINCGHPPARLLRRDGRIEDLPGETCMPLGVLPELMAGPRAGGQVMLHPGDRLVLYTDGVTEAMSPERELFGADRLDQVLRECAPGADDGAQQVVDAVVRAVQEHRAGAAPSDDVCLVVLHKV
jgi:sigma-B regulation protein RsbU (phosphoserine phosphatase)